MARWLIALSLLAAAVLAHPARAAEQSDVSRIFKESFIPSANQSCIANGKARSNGQLSDAKIDAYCGCAGKSMIDGFSDAEKQELMSAGGPPSEPVRQKLHDLIRHCQEEHLR